MRAVVLDASTTLALLLPDERSFYAIRLLDLLEKSPSIFVPAHWWIETLNGVLTAERRRRISRPEGLELVRDLLAMPVTTDEETITRVADETLSLGREYGLSIYDAAYLELAIRRASILATLDKALARAARRAGVALLE